MPDPFEPPVLRAGVVIRDLSREACAEGAATWSAEGDVAKLARFGAVLQRLLLGRELRELTRGLRWRITVDEGRGELEVRCCM